LNVGFPSPTLPGARFVISDAPGTARMWMRPARRLRGVAAWQGEALPGSNGGPPMTRWPRDDDPGMGWGFVR